MLSTSGGMLNFPSSGEYNPSPGDTEVMQRHSVQVISLQTVNTSSSIAKKKKPTQKQKAKTLC